jgi:hypothetical protein
MEYAEVVAWHATSVWPEATDREFRGGWEQFEVEQGLRVRRTE